MATLLLKFNAPIQSWGTSLKLKDHDTDQYPSKSGVIGMIASALGRKRNDDISDLVNLRFGVRIDQAGLIIDDFQVSEIPAKEKKIGHRKYITDADFTCGIEADDKIIENIKEALQHPANALFLGRRGCPVTIDLIEKITQDSLEDALNDYDKTAGSKRIIMDSCEPGGEMVRDIPLSFSPSDRKYKYRFITIR